MSLQLKIRITASGATKTMRFAETMSVFEVLKTIEEKTSEGGKDHGLFKPLNEDSSTKGGKWLDVRRTLEFYDIRSNDLVEFRKKHEVIKVKLVDNSVKTLLADVSVPVTEVVALVGKKIGIKNPEEFGLQPDSGADWFKNDLSLLEQVDKISETFLLKKKFFVSDANVDKDDPVQLHLVYSQSKTDIIAGKQPTGKEEAIQLAALQCQIDNGNLNPQNPVIEAIKIFAPHWQKNSDCAKAVLTEWKKLAGMTEINAKFRYVQYCRSLKTYGITLFNIQERDKKSKKLFKKLLGFTRDSIIRMDEDCKQIEVTWPLNHLRRWAASSDTFTLDFGSHEDDYVTVITKEGEQMSAIIAGYIDILLKKQRDTGVVVDDDNTEIGQVSEVGSVRAQGVMSTTTTTIGKGAESYSKGVTDLDSASRAVNKMINQLFGDISPEEANQGTMTQQQRRQQLVDHGKTVEDLSNKFLSLVANPQAMNMTEINSTSKMLSVGLENLVKSARNANAIGMDPDGLLFDGVKGLADSLEKLMLAAQDVKKNPNDPEARARLQNATQQVQAAISRMKANNNGMKGDEAFQKLFNELSKAVAVASGDLLQTASYSQIGNPAMQGQVDQSKDAVRLANQHLLDLANLLSSTAQDPSCKSHLEQGGRALLNAAQLLQNALLKGGLNPNDQNNLTYAMSKLNDALSGLLQVTDLPELEGGKAASEFSTAAQTITDSCTQLMGSFGKRDVIKQATANIDNGIQSLIAATKMLAESQDPQTRERMLAYSDEVAKAVQQLMMHTPGNIANPSDEKMHAQLRQAAQLVSDATNLLVNDAGKEVALSALYSACKIAAAQTTNLIVASNTGSAYINDPQKAQLLSNQAKGTANAITELVETLKHSINPKQGVDPTTGLMIASEKFSPVAYKLVSTAKQVAPTVSDPNVKKNLLFASDNCAKAIHKLLVNRKATRAKIGNADITEALEQFQAAEAELEAALLSISQGMLEKTGITREQALKNLNEAVKNIATSTKNLAAVAKDTPEELGPTLKALAVNLGQVVSTGKVLAATVEDKQLQKGILNTIGQLTGQVNQLIQASRAVANSPNDVNLTQLLQDAGKGVASALAQLVQASKGVVPKEIEDFHSKSGKDIEDLAEKELQGCADVINKAVARMKKAQEEAAKLRNNPNVDINQSEITASILEACMAIGQATSVLIGSASTVQMEFNKMSKAPSTKNVYKRDPTWAQGLISASQEVAASVQFLVTVSDKAVRGECEEEALIVAANQVSAATTRLVTASTVKTNVSSQNQSKLINASKSVSAATRSLVDAAKEHAKFQDEMQQREASKFELSDSRVREMEEQMEILRMERELEKKRMAMLKKRKEEYGGETKPQTPTPQTSVTPAPKSAPRGGPPRGGPPRGRRGPPRGGASSTLRDPSITETGKVLWRSSGVGKNDIEHVQEEIDYAENQ